MTDKQTIHTPHLDNLCKIALQMIYMSRVLVLQPHYVKFPYDFSVKFSDKIGKTWVDILSAADLYSGLTLNSVLLTFENDHRLW